MSDWKVSSRVSSTPSLKVAIYTRVSTGQQSDVPQFEQLSEVASRCGWVVVSCYREVASGAKGPTERKQLELLLKGARLREFDKLVVWSVDRLARSMKELIIVLSELKSANVDVFSYKQGIDTSTPMGSMLWQFLGIFAEFENDIRKERQLLGIAKARSQGVTFGRPKITIDTVNKIRTLRGQGLSMATIAGQAEVGVGTVFRTLKYLNPENFKATVE